MSPKTLAELANKNLTGFRIIEMTEAFEVDKDGSKVKSIGYFKDPDTAKAYSNFKETNSYKRIRTVFVLTNDAIGFVINKVEEVNLIGDEVAMLEIKEKVFAKLTPEERKVLKLE